jgi:hypothetical protein
LRLLTTAPPASLFMGTSADRVSPPTSSSTFPIAASSSCSALTSYVTLTR